MQVETLRIKNLRSICDLEVNFQEVTTLLGANNVGKSTILQAFDFFFSGSVKLTEDDLHNRSSEEIEITIKFNNLTHSEIEEFGSAVIDNTMTIMRTLTITGEGHLQYSALAHAYPGFAEVRAETNKTNIRTAFNQLASTIEGLEPVRSAEQADSQMSQWEQANPEQLELVYLRGFFGAPNVANGKLKKKTSLHLIPAVADAQQETGTSKSPILQLLSDISKQIYENRIEVQEFIQQVNTDFEGLVSPDNFPQLAGISESLTSTIQQYYSDSKLLAEWQHQEGIKVNFPQPSIRVEDQGFVTGLENVGHGLQRASLFAIIQFLAEQDARADGQGQDFTEAQSDIVLLVEEPEIYQHPHKQELICEAFHSICRGFSSSTGIRFQIIFTTHSEKFIGIQKFQSARILRRHSNATGTIHSASSVSIQQCCDYFAGLVEKPPMAVEAFEAKMHIFSREVCEGFFADKVILVEGVTDKAILEGYYRSLGRNHLSDGISIIQMDGKSKMDKPFYIFQELGIPVFCVFDSDASKKEKHQRSQSNILIQKIAGVTDLVDFPDGCFSKHSAFQTNLENHIRTIIGDRYDEFFEAVSEQFGLPISEISKTPAAVEKIASLCRENGIEIIRFNEIIEAVDAL